VCSSIATRIDPACNHQKQPSVQREDGDSVREEPLRPLADALDVSVADLCEG
jgi:hypothetical protein